MIDGKTRVFALLGDPVAHSLSPEMQNAAFRALGFNAVYIPLRCSSQAVPELMYALASAGGGGNVTVPHKEVAAQVVSQAGGGELIACNTFWGDVSSELVPHGAAALRGENTDVVGILAGLTALDAPPSAWLVAGTGGSAKAVAIAARDRGARLAVHSRSRPRADDFRAFMRRLGVATAEPEECDVLINATPLGLGSEDALPLSQSLAPHATVALDLVYQRGQTPWIRAMATLGLRAGDGREVLVSQGAAALERWFPGVAAPLEIMRAAIHAALR